MWHRGAPSRSQLGATLLPMRRTVLWLVLAAVLAGSCSSEGSTTTSTANEATTAALAPEDSTSSTSSVEPPEPLRGELNFEIVATYPHSITSFTQGLEFLDDGRLVESLGLYGESGRAVVDLNTGEQLAFEPLAANEFGEGMTQAGDELVQITYVSETAIVSDAATLAEKRRYSYEGEGWGICFNGTEFVMSDGSEVLTFRDPQDFGETSSVRVRSDDSDLLGQLNELECVGSQIWANVYFQNRLIAIDSDSGTVQAWVDLESIAPEKVDNLDVMNGIAYRPETDTFFITGKRWPQIFELRLTNR